MNQVHMHGQRSIFNQIVKDLSIYIVLDYMLVDYMLYVIMTLT